MKKFLNTAVLLVIATGLTLSLSGCLGMTENVANNGYLGTITEDEIEEGEENKCDSVENDCLW